MAMTARTWFPELCEDKQASSCQASRLVSVPGQPLRQRQVPLFCGRPFAAAFKRLSPSCLLLADRLSSGGPTCGFHQLQMVALQHFFLTRSYPILPHPGLPLWELPCSAPKSPWRDPAGSLLLRLLSRLSVDFNGCVL